MAWVRCFLVLVMFGFVGSARSQAALADATPTASGTDITGANPAGCVTDYDPDTDYFPEKLTVDYASTFSIDYANNYKVLRGTFSDAANGIHTNTTVVLVQCGTPAPPLTGDLAGATTLEIPIKTVAFNDDGPLTMVHQLGLTDRIVAMGGGGVYDPELRSRFEDGTIASIGYGYAGPPDFERLVDLSPDLTVFFGGDAQAEGNLDRAHDLGLTAVPDFYWVESSPLGKAEWLKYHATFYNAEAAASTLFGEIAGTYESLKAAALAQPTKPTTFWADAGEGGFWYLDGSTWANDLLTDAGAINLFPVEAYEVSAESVIDAATDADVWICGAMKASDWPADAPLDEFKAYRDGRVYHVHNRVNLDNDAYDFYETAVVRPDLLLADLVKIFHPELVPDHELFFLAPQSRD